MRRLVDEFSITVADNTASSLSSISISDLPNIMFGVLAILRLEYGPACCSAASTYVSGSLDDLQLQSVTQIPAPAGIVLYGPFMLALFSLAPIKNCAKKL